MNETERIRRKARFQQFPDNRMFQIKINELNKKCPANGFLYFSWYKYQRCLYALKYPVLLAHQSHIIGHNLFNFKMSILIQESYWTLASNHLIRKPTWNISFEWLQFHFVFKADHDILIHLILYWNLFFKPFYIHLFFHTFLLFYSA